LQVANEIAPSGRRAGTLSAFLLACYVGASVPVIGIGVVTELVSTHVADVAFAALLCVLALAAIVMGWRLGKQTHEGAYL
jgi:hypothetical protein